MIEYIKNIGEVIRTIEGEKELVDLWQKDTKEFDNLIIVNIDEDTEKADMELRQFTKSAYRDSLLYQQGNFRVGAAVKIEKFKRDKKNIEEIENRIKKSLAFMELDFKYLNNISSLILDEVGQNTTQTYYAMLTKNGKTPLELYKREYESKIKKTCLNKQSGLSICHLCGIKDKNYETILFNCYTNDKKIYTNTNGYNFCVCENCLYDLLNGRKYINENLTSFWAGSDVIFLPHNYDEETKEIYEQNKVDGSGKISRFLDNIRVNEEEVLDCISQTFMTDILFFYNPKASSEWKIQYSIRDVMPSRFNIVAKGLKKYTYRNSEKFLKLGNIMNYLCLSDGKSESRNKDRFRLLDIIFHGKNYSRSLFFNRIMTKYKSDYFKGYKQMSTIHRIYNFLCDCGCLENGWYLVNKNDEGSWEEVTYKSVEEFFDRNHIYFNTDEKKAWFLIGKVYNSTIYYSKAYKVRGTPEADNEDKNQIGSQSSHLEKSFFFGRKFNFDSFINFANTCTQKLSNYGTYYTGIKNKINLAKEYMQNGENKLRSDEAKYIFFWGMDMYFDNKKEDVQ